jgi:Spy/CpxP family protein refolding chaperone
MKKHTVTIATLAIAALGLISVAAAQGPGGGHMRRPGGEGFGPGGGPGGPRVEMIAERLGLSDEQKAQWTAIHEKARESGQPLIKAAGEAKEAFDTALQAENADAATVGQAALAMKSAHGKVEAHQKEMLESVKAILTPEQLAKFEEMGNRMRRSGPGGPKGQGMRKPDRS